MRKFYFAGVLPVMALGTFGLLCAMPANAQMIVIEDNDTTEAPSSTVLQSDFQQSQTLLATGAVVDHLFMMNTGTPPGDTGISTGDEPLGLNVWMTPYLVSAKDKNAATGYSSDTVGVFLGGDTKINDMLTAGLMLGIDSTDVDSKVNGGGTDMLGLTIAPYGRYTIDKNYSVDASIGYTNSNSDNARLASGTRVTSSSDLDRFFFSAGVNGNFWHDRWNFAGRLGTSNSHDKSGSYTESNGTVISGKSTSFGQLQLGGTASYYFENVRPWVSLTYSYDYNRDLPVVAASQPKPSDDRDQVILGYGATVFNFGQVNADLSIKHTLFKDKYNNTNAGITFSTSF